MAFDIKSARENGYSDSEIADFLSKNHPNFDVQGALNSGYSLDDISGEFESPTISGNPPLNPNQERTSGKDFLRSPALPIIGGVIGGTVGGIPGAMLGGAAGESYRQMGARGVNLPVPSTPWEAAKDIGIEGLTQGAGEAINPLTKLAGKGVMALPYVGAGIKAAGKTMKQTAGQLFQLVTKIKPELAETLFKNPSAILPGKMTAAKEAWRTAAKNAGLPIDDVSPEIIQALKSDAKNTVFGTFQRVQAGEKVSASELQTAKEAIRIALKPAAKTERNKPLIVLYDKMSDVFRKGISKESPELAAANKQYAIAKAGDAFKSIFPRNLDESPAYFRSSVLPSILTGAGAYRGEPVEGAMQGAAVTAALSPLTMGLGIAGAGASRMAVPYARRAITSSMAELMKKKYLENE